MTIKRSTTKSRSTLRRLLMEYSQPFQAWISKPLLGCLTPLICTNLVDTQSRIAQSLIKTWPRHSLHPVLNLSSRWLLMRKLIIRIKIKAHLKFIANKRHQLDRISSRRRQAVVKAQLKGKYRLMRVDLSPLSSLKSRIPISLLQIMTNQIISKSKWGSAAKIRGSESISRWYPHLLTCISYNFISKTSWRGSKIRRVE